MNLNVTHRYDRQVTAEGHPMRTSIPRSPRSHLGADVQQIAILRILANDVHPSCASGQITSNSRPRLSVIIGHESIWRVIVVLMMVRRDVCSARVNVRSFDSWYPRIWFET